MSLETGSAYVVGEEVPRLVGRQGKMRRELLLLMVMLGLLGKEGSETPGLAIACVDPNPKAKNHQHRNRLTWKDGDSTRFFCAGANFCKMMK